MTATTTGFSLTVNDRTFDVFYDRAVRLWTVIEMDEAQSQIGDAQYAQTRDMACVYVGLTAATPR